MIFDALDFETGQRKNVENSNSGDNASSLTTPEHGPSNLSNTAQQKWHASLKGVTIALNFDEAVLTLSGNKNDKKSKASRQTNLNPRYGNFCLLYTSDAADE